MSAVSISCVTHSGADAQPADRDGSASTSPAAPSLVAIAFSGDGSHAAYAVRRSRRLPRDGTSEDACVIFVARTRAAASHGGGGGGANEAATTTSSTAAAAAADTSSAGAPSEFSRWLVTQVLAGGHEAPITSLAWCPRTSALLSVSADRAACVWVPQRGSGDDAATTHHFCAVPQLVMLSAEVRLSPTCAAWSVDGAKLYIGTAGGTVAVGRYDVRQRWWLCRVMDTAPAPSTQTDDGGGAVASARAAAAATALVAHPTDNTRVAVTTLDGTVQVRSTYIKSVDGAHSAARRDDAEGAVEVEAAHAPPPPFGHLHFSHRFPCWVHDADWSPCGRQLVVVSHDSSLHVWGWSIDLPCTPTHTAVLLRQLPLSRCVFLTESLLAAACFDGFVYAFTRGHAATAPGGSTEAAWRLVKPHAAGTSDGTSTAAHLHGSAATHRDPSAAAIVEAVPMVKSVRQRARELLERGRAAAASKRQTTASHTSTTTSAGGGARGSASERPALRAIAPHRSPIHLLVRVPPPPPPAETSRVEATIASAGHDGQVHLWRVCATATTATTTVPASKAK